jgi:uncharacterized protein (DUF1501 family)
MHQSRRSFLATASLAAAGNALGFRPFGMLNALAQTTSDYKALVCVFMFGGNDANNMLIPFDNAGYANYSTIRGALALPQSALLPFTAQPAFALHPSMPEVQALFDNNNAAFLANVGTLLSPTTAAQYQAKQVITPSNLFSHPDQQLEWQNQMQNGSGSSGWAGRIADKLNTQYNPGGLVPMIASLSGDALFCNGTTTSPVAVSSSGPGAAGCSDHSYCSGRQQTAQQFSTLSSGVSLIQADNGITNNAYSYNATLSGELATATPLQTVFPTTGNAFGAQLQEVAKLIQVRAALGITRQIFFVGSGGFDTHGDQLDTQAALLGQLSPALGAFYQALTEMNLADTVTTFTCSDFARALQPNSAGGTDHAWGSHHIVMGGAVKGGKVYGTFPTLALGGPDDAGVNGRWVPTTASAQYAATLAQWFGLAAADLPYVLPYIGNFSSNNLGFLGAVAAT